VLLTGVPQAWAGRIAGELADDEVRVELCATG